MNVARGVSGIHLKSSLPNWRLRVKPGSVYEPALERGGISRQPASDYEETRADRESSWATIS